MPDEPRHRIKPSLLRRARDLRQDATFPERVVWGRLRNRQLCGLKFRRQTPRDAFVTDFLCHERKLIVEVDGRSHVDREKDEARSQVLERDGFRVIRFTNDDVLGDMDAVLRTILRECGLPTD
jgi:crossover junction endodeoxyribonuclease RuvC